MTEKTDVREDIKNVLIIALFVRELFRTRCKEKINPLSSRLRERVFSASRMYGYKQAVKQPRDIKRRKYLFFLDNVIIIY